MGHIYRGNAELPLDPFDGVAHLYPELGIQIGKRLVHQQHLRLNDNSPGQGHPLLLAAGEVGRHTVLQVVNFYDFQNVVDLLFDFLLGQFPVLQSEGHVVENVHVGKHGIVLKDHANIPLVGRNVVDYPIIDLKGAALNGIEADDHPQQCGLAAAGGSQQGEELPGLDLQRQPIDDGFLAIPLDGIFYGNGCAHMFNHLSFHFFDKNRNVIARQCAHCRGNPPGFQAGSFNRGIATPATSVTGSQ